MAMGGAYYIVKKRFLLTVVSKNPDAKVEDFFTNSLAGSSILKSPTFALP